MRSSSSAAGTSQDSIAVPCRPLAERAHEVVVVRELAGRDRRELVDAEAQVARRRAQAAGRRPLAVARVAVAGAAEVGVDVAAVLERGGGDAAPAERHRRDVNGGGAPAGRRHPSPRPARGRRHASRMSRARSCHAHREVDDQPDDGDEVHVDRREAQPARARLGAGRPRSSKAIATRPPSTCSAWNADSAKNASPSAPVPGPRWAGHQATPQRRLHQQEEAPRPSAPAAHAAPGARPPQREAGRDQQQAVGWRRRPAETAASRAAATPAPACARPRRRAAAPRTASRRRPGRPSCRRRRSRHSPWHGGRLPAHDSTSSCASQSLPRARASGLANSCGPRTTVGMTSKLWCGGGDGSVHSSVPTSHGFARPFLPRRRLAKKFKTKRSWPRRARSAAREIHWLSGSRCWRKCTGTGRRGAAAARVARHQLPAEHEGERHEREPEVQLAERLVHHPAEHLREPEVDRREARRGTSAAAIVRWKWPTTNMVSWR